MSENPASFLDKHQTILTDLWRCCGADLLALKKLNQAVSGGVLRLVEIGDIKPHVGKVFIGQQGGMVDLAVKLRNGELSL